jgi:RHS repeat-associated protein
LARTSSGGTTAWYLPDKLGTVRDIVDGSGNELDHIVYDSFGNITTETNAANGDRFKFGGMEFDSVTGQYYDNARWYGSATGRFDIQDPMGFAAGDADLYRYVANDPIGEVDPSGLEDVPEPRVTPVGISGNPTPDQQALIKEAKSIVKEMYEKSPSYRRVLDGTSGKVTLNFTPDPTRVGTHSFDSVIIYATHPEIKFTSGPVRKSIIQDVAAHEQIHSFIDTHPHTDLDHNKSPDNSKKSPFPLFDYMNKNHPDPGNSRLMDHRKSDYPNRYLDIGPRSIGLIKQVQQEVTSHSQNKPTP